MARSKWTRGKSHYHTETMPVLQRSSVHQTDHSKWVRLVQSTSIVFCVMLQFLVSAKPTVRLWPIKDSSMHDNCLATIWCWKIVKCFANGWSTNSIFRNFEQLKVREEFEPVLWIDFICSHECIEWTDSTNIMMNVASSSKILCWTPTCSTLTIISSWCLMTRRTCISRILDMANIDEKSEKWGSLGKQATYSWNDL